MRIMSDSELIQHALYMWANYIETGDVVLSATDADTIGQAPKALDTHQMKMVIRLRELASKQGH